MATTLNILGWTAKGLRCPDHSISFEKNGNEVYKITLIQMPNGTGKTTTLKLLRAALSGPTIWNSNFDKPLQFRKDSNTDIGSFELKLKHTNRILTIKMEFDFTTEEEVPLYKTTTVHGIDEGFRLPDELIPFLTPDFVKLLIFDGELANQLLDARHTNAQQAIEVLYRLPLLKQMSDRIENYWSNIANSAGSSGGKKEFSRRKGKVDGLKNHIKEVEEKKKEDEQKLEEINGKLKDLEQEFSEEIKKNTEDNQKLEQAERELEKAKLNLFIGTQTLAGIIKNPAELAINFDKEIVELKGSFDRVKLPGIAAREFFEEIADEEDCICGREINEEISKTIRKKADEYLGSEEVATLNAMKSEINGRLNEDGTLSENLLSEQIEEVEKMQNNVSLARQKLDAIKISAGDKDPEIKRIHDQITDLTEKKGELTTNNLKYIDTLDQTDNSWNPEVLKRNLKQAEDALAETTGTINQKKKKDILQDILNNALEDSKQLLSERICESTNKKIEALMPYNNIRVDKIDRNIRLVDKENGSAGETLTVSYAYLSSLLSNSDHILPSVIDSPSGPIDLEIRPEIGRLIPKLNEQFICFIISSERQKFVAPLVESASEAPYFLTLFRKGNINLEASINSIKDNVIKTIDGICVEGQMYFNEFHSDNEEKE
ncbi:MAG: hypothetical protein P1U44_10940 [Vicingaceae bacterium]|nr:hypothetical protein [Vicingaceae bacterium]